MIQVTPEQVCLASSNFNFKNIDKVYKGKVRDVYHLADRLIIITTDRISAFDHVLPRPIPYKGQVLNQIAVHFLHAVEDICPTWLIDTPDPNVSIGHKCQPISLEMVIRGYMAGHLWREYKQGKRLVCGVELKEGYKEGDQLETPIITPTTKASEGHDEDISYDAILANQIVSKELLDELYRLTYALYTRGTTMARDRGLILVDTKYEFGLHQGLVTLMDEIHTPDSSRYYIADGYEARQASGTSQIQLSKEFVREWLIDHHFMGKEDQLMPEMPSSFVWEISRRYRELYERIIGTPFEIEDTLRIEERIKNNLQNYF